MTQKHLEKGIMAIVIAFIAAIVLLSSAHAQTGLLPLPKMQFFDANGNPLAGGFVYTYAAGTTTPLSTCTDQSCGTPQTSPVELDSGGYADIWLQSASYKIVLKTSLGVTVWSVDHVSAACPLAGCSMIGRLNVDPTSGIAIEALSTNDTAVQAQTNGTSAIAVSGNATGGGSSIGVFGGANSATGFGVKAKNSNASGKIYSGINSAGSETFSVANTGAVASSSTITATGVVSGSQLTSTVATGTAPLVITSTTPVANLTGQILVYGTTGTQITNSHAVIGSCTLGTNCAVTLTGAAVFTSSASYVCEAQDTTAAAATKIVYTSGSQFTITGTGTDSLTFKCMGN